jgi:hypothetical protein
LDEIIISSKEVFKDSESETAVWSKTLGDPTQESAASNDIVQQTAGSYLLTPQLQANKSDL